MLRNPSIPQWLVIANIGLAILLIGISFYNSMVLVLSPMLTFPLSGATLLYFIWLRWQMIIPPRDVEGDIIKIRLPISISTSIWMSIITLLCWALFPPMSIALSNLNETTEHIGDTDIMYHLYYGIITICSIIFVLIILLIANAIGSTIQKRGITRWRRLLVVSIEAICTIALYFTIYAVGFFLTY